jgi:uncharacterized protein (TIGR02145 family)
MRNNILTLSLLLVAICAVNAQTIMNIHQSNGTVLQIPVNTIDSITYTISNPGNLASITTTAVSNITGTTAFSGGNITNNGGSLVTQRGVCYNTSANPTTANSTIISGSGTGSFTSNLTALTANTTYYVRAYAINSAGTAYGNQVSFTTTSGSGSGISNPGLGVTFNGYTYSTVILGNGQEWMAENLRTANYANGDPIPNVTDATQWGNLTTGAWVHYNNDSQYENPYGKLYNWYTVADPRNVCPTGWHVPTDSEWNLLVKYIDNQADTICGGCSQSAIAGGKMKSTGTQYWLSPNTDATNQSGFSGLPGGNRGIVGTFYGIGVYSLWWSSSEYGANNAWGRVLLYDNGNVDRSSNGGKASGFSVRCLKN